LFLSRSDASVHQAPSIEENRNQSLIDAAASAMQTNPTVLQVDDREMSVMWKRLRIAPILSFMGCASDEVQVFVSIDRSNRKPEDKPFHPFVSLLFSHTIFTRHLPPKKKTEQKIASP
jgi:hypothetical protein